MAKDNKKWWIIGGILGGIAVAHVFKSTVNQVWSEIPVLNQFPANN